MKLPSKIIKKDDDWIFTGLKNKDERLDKYLKKNSVKDPEDLTENDLPATDNDKVRKLDEEALDTGYLSGRWNVPVVRSEIDDLWKKIEDLVSDYMIWCAQVSKNSSRVKSKEKIYSLMIYTPNYFDKDDVFRVRDILREECGIHKEIFYKPDIYTMLHINKYQAKSMGLPMENRYRS
ncbi:MAG: putative phosphothreonine lyase domain-containing protein [Thermoplasmatota archaeon]